VANDYAESFHARLRDDELEQAILLSKGWSRTIQPLPEVTSAAMIAVFANFVALKDCVPMADILISWFSKNNDLLWPRNGEQGAITFNDGGPHAQLYRSRYFLDGGNVPCSKHYMAFQPEDREVVEGILIPALSKLHRDGKSYLEPLCQPTIPNEAFERDDEIQTVLVRLFTHAQSTWKERYDDVPGIHVFLNPGLPIMQVGWTVLADRLGATLWRQTPESKAKGKKKLSNLITQVRTEPTVEIGPSSPPRLLPGSLSEKDKEKLFSYAEGHAPFLLTGPAGCGKTKLGEEIHRMSGRPGLFRKISVADMPITLAQAELFGHRKGGFTDATKDRIGRVEACHRGTLFIDEIHHAPIETQAILVGMLSEPDQPTKFTPLGTNEELTSDVRYIFATNEDLAKSKATDKFMADLLDRVNVSLKIELRPPDLQALTDSELKGLFRDVWNSATRDDNVRACPRLTADAMETLRGLGTVTPRTLRKLCVSIIGNRNWRGTRELDAALLRKALDNVTIEPIGAARSEDPWVSALSGLLSVKGADALLRAIHKSFSQLNPKYVARFVRTLKRPEHSELHKHLESEGVPTSTKRFGEHLKRAGLR